MHHSSGTFEGQGGCHLYYQSWTPEGDPHAALAILTGFGEHSGRYMNLVDCLVPHGFTVIGFDNRGHGLSEGRRGHIDRWSDYRFDTAKFLELVRQLQPGIPVFLYGHSLGALIGLEYLLHTSDSLSGGVLSGLPLEPVGVAKPALVLLAKTLSTIWPTCQLKVGLDPNHLSRDTSVARAYEDDPLVHGTATTRWGTEGLKTVAWVKTRAAEIHLPILVIHGGADPINLPSGSRSFFEGITFPDKTLKIYPGSLHEPHNDLDHEQVAADLEQWMASHLPD
jgi:alpha-beta hydrolase superfamily lysophospholipase